MQRQWSRSAALTGVHLVTVIWVVAATLQIELLSPLPCISTGDDSCECTYQALPMERPSFVAVAHYSEAIAMNFVVLKNGTHTPMLGCFTEECPRNITCYHSCNTSQIITRAIGLELYKVHASPYNQRIGDVVKSVCIQVNRSVGLTFDLYPGQFLAAVDGTVTLSYSATGYPFPEAYALSCDRHVTRQQSKEGVFHLRNLPEGQLRCRAEAVNRVSRALSDSTLISVTRLSGAEGTSRQTPSSGLASSAEESAITGQVFIIAGSILGAGLTVGIPMTLCCVLRRRRCAETKVPRQIVNIVNDNSRHITNIHNGSKVESYGPGSVIHCHGDSAAAFPLLCQRQGSGSEASCNDVWPEYEESARCAFGGEPVSPVISVFRSTADRSDNLRRSNVDALEGPLTVRKAA